MLPHSSDSRTRQPNRSSAAPAEDLLVPTAAANSSEMASNRLRVGIVGSGVDRAEIERFGVIVEDDSPSDGSTTVTTQLLRTLVSALGVDASSLTVVVSSPLRFGLASELELVRSLHWLSGRQASLIILAMERSGALSPALLNRLTALDCEVRWVSTTAELEEVTQVIRSQIAELN